MNDRMKELVELLAENTHNVWAKERIKHGWTYGLSEVNSLTLTLTEILLFNVDTIGFSTKTV